MAELTGQIKELHNVGDKVFACWRDMGDETSWYPAIVKSFQIVGKSVFGDIRSYHIVFADEDEDDDSGEAFLKTEEEYQYSLLEFSTFKGLRNKCFEGFKDEYAEIQGGYVTDLTGNTIFSAIGAAGRARDDKIVERDGRRVRKSDLNFPAEWEFPSSTKERSPVRRVRCQHVGVACTEADKGEKRTTAMPSCQHLKRKRADDAPSLKRPIDSEHAEQDTTEEEESKRPAINDISSSGRKSEDNTELNEAKDNPICTAEDAKLSVVSEVDNLTQEINRLHQEHKNEVEAFRKERTSWLKRVEEEEETMRKEHLLKCSQYLSSIEALSKRVWNHAKSMK